MAPWFYLEAAARHPRPLLNASTSPSCIRPAAVPIEFMDPVNAFLRERHRRNGRLAADGTEPTGILSSEPATLYASRGSQNTKPARENSHPFPAPRRIM